MHRVEQNIRILVGTKESQPKVAIVGAGNSAHVLVALLGSVNFSVNVLALKDELPHFNGSIELDLEQSGVSLKRWDGRLNRISTEPDEIIADADYVILCLPVGKYREALKRISPHVSKAKRVFIGTVYGQGGFNWMIDELVKKYDRPNVVGFAIGLIPWICRVREYGKSVTTYGCKTRNYVAVTAPRLFPQLNRELLQFMCEKPFGAGPFELADCFLSLTLSVDNQIIHPARCYGLFAGCGGRWKSQAEVPYFYRDFDKLSASVLEGLDADYSAIRQGIRDRFPSMKFWHMKSYLELERYTLGSSSTDVRRSFSESVQLRDIKPPTVHDEQGGIKLNTAHRFFHDEFQFGLCIAKWFATHLGVKVATIDKVLAWAQELKGERLIEGDRLLLESDDLTDRAKFGYSGVPSVYGFTSIEQALG